LPDKQPDPNPAPLESLIETLNLLISQARAYERILPAQGQAGRAAVAVLGELARKALNEAESLAEALAPRPGGSHPFSPRELQVLQLAAHGLTNKEIAYRLGISERTVQFHMNSIFNKTATSTRTEAVALALRSHWIAQEPIPH
jgi:two-component system, NarL family, response regulator LiaR